ncbi:MAG TPA: septation protein SepH, partial [Nocardioides sp.]
RRSALPADELPLGDDAIELVTDADRSVAEPAPTTALDDTTEIEQVDVRDDHEAAPAADEPPAARPTKKRGRASVPSWDEIMFGGGKAE